MAKRSQNGSQGRLACGDLNRMARRQSAGGVAREPIRLTNGAPRDGDAAPDVASVPSPVTNGRTPPIGLTLAWKKGKVPLSKRITIRDGQVVSDSSVCQVWDGTLTHHELSHLSDLVPLLERLSSQEALVLGTLKDPEHRRGPMLLTSQKQAADGAIVRTLDYLHYPPGVPALLLIDFDCKGMSDAMRVRMDEAGGLWPLLCQLVPALKGLATVSRASTSAGLITPDGDTHAGSSGRHIYAVVEDGADSARALKVLHERMWLAGFGWCVLSKGGALLVRSLVDAGVGSPERLVFEGAPQLRNGLRQDPVARLPTYSTGGWLNSLDALPSRAIAFDWGLAL